MKLSETVKLEGSWEVGLLEVTFLGKVVNIFGNRFHYELCSDKTLWSGVTIDAL